MGDRIRTGAMTIACGQTHIELLAAGPEDPVFCPSQKLKLSYVLSKGKWLKSVLVSAGQSDVASHSQTDITGRAYLNLKMGKGQKMAVQFLKALYLHKSKQSSYNHTIE